ncbi:hypothetical protein GE061_014824 [Apolygus lucorum]|uniref:Phospholipase A2-like domain-containing protein n=1 Tax=Apolygus lucorum TaxID=248454 RepID=A0A8S9XLC2_APOLU|nr:hypothetical protein GE061_014824 [Apolygus lucorum]
MGPHRGKGLIDFLVDHNPFNLTLPGLNYCGPGNDLKSQIARNISPTNPLDNACRAHDIAYENSKDSSVRRAADQKLLDAALERIKSSQSSFLEKVGAANSCRGDEGQNDVGRKIGTQKIGAAKTSSSAQYAGSGEEKAKRWKTKKHSLESHFGKAGNCDAWRLCGASRGETRSRCNFATLFKMLKTLPDEPLTSKDMFNFLSNHPASRDVFDGGEQLPFILDGAVQQTLAVITIV